MRTLLAILSLLVCMGAFARHIAIKDQAQINLPSYIKRRSWRIVFALLCLITVALGCISIINLSWYWCVLISIPVSLVLALISILLTDGYSYVTGGDGIDTWGLLVFSFVLAILSVVCYDGDGSTDTRFISEFGYPSYFCGRDDETIGNVSSVDIHTFQIENDASSNKDTTPCKEISIKHIDKEKGSWFYNSSKAWKVHVEIDPFTIKTPGYTAIYFLKDDNGDYYPHYCLRVGGDVVTGIDLFLYSSNKQLNTIESYNWSGYKYTSQNYFDLCREVLEMCEDELCFDEREISAKRTYYYHRGRLVREEYKYGKGEQKWESKTRFRVRNKQTRIYETFYEQAGIAKYEYQYSDGCDLPFSETYRFYRTKSVLGLTVFKTLQSTVQKSYTYEEFDDYGNWTSRLEKVIENGEVQPMIMTKREILYE